MAAGHPHRAWSDDEDLTRTNFLSYGTVCEFLPSVSLSLSLTHTHTLSFSLANNVARRIAFLAYGGCQLDELVAQKLLHVDCWSVCRRLPFGIGIG